MYANNLLLLLLILLFFSRFILNIPDDPRPGHIRTFFNIELAHWFYIDFFVPEDPNLKGVGIKEFASQNILFFSAYPIIIIIIINYYYYYYY